MFRSLSMSWPNFFPFTEAFQSCAISASSFSIFGFGGLESWQETKLDLFYVTVATDELLSDKNAGAWVSMVSYLKKINYN